MQSLFISSTLAMLLSGCSLNPKIEMDMESFLKKEVTIGKTPSVQYLMFNQDSIIQYYRFGYADIKNGKHVNPQTTYNAYSITKTFTALAVMQLAEQQLVDIDRPVVSYLTDFPYNPDITIRHVLSHSSGIPNPIPLSWIHLINEHDTFNQGQFFEQIMLQHDNIKFNPNDKFAYTNLGYIILGQLIEKITGSRYDEDIQENIIREMDLTPRGLGFTVENEEDHATGYHPKLSLTNAVLGFFMKKSKYMGAAEGKWKPFHHFYVNGSAYGGLIGTPSAFARYGQEWLRPGSKLISPEMKKALFAENYTNDGKATGMCLSWFTGQLNGHTYYAHAGGGGGYYAELRVYPDLGIGSFIVFNRSGMADERYLDKVDHFWISENIPMQSNLSEFSHL